MTSNTVVAEATVRLVAITQDYENYGENGRDHWKAKGGIEVLVATLTIDEASMGQSALQALVDVARNIVECQGNEFERRIIGWNLYFAGELTPDEKLCVEFEEEITPPYTLESLQERQIAA
jgi:hypothetical protein